MQHSETDNNTLDLPYTHCLNCGTELMGGYCHNCGQEVEDKTPTITGFVMEYLNNAFIWDPQFFKTFWRLISRPGHLTNEFLAGKFISQEHPLKLNMFLLFVFVTLFLFFTSTEKMTAPVDDVIGGELVLPGVQLGVLADDKEYVLKMEESARDTISLHAPLFLAENHPTIISNIKTIEDTQGEGLDRWIASVPRILIEDEIIVKGDTEYYHFNTETDIGNTEIGIVSSIWSEMVRITSQYFPMLLLLTAPFLSMSLGLVQRRSRLPRINHFIFSLHYTAFLESLMIAIFVLHLLFAPSLRVLEWIMIIGSCTYLTIAFRKVYNIKSWIMALVKSLLTSVTYYVILLAIFVGIFISACFIIVANHI